MDETDIVLTAGKKFGVDEALLIYTSKVDIKQQMLLQCQFTCKYYGKYYTCPPRLNTVDKTRELLKEYKKAILVIGDQGRMELRKFKRAMLAIETTLKLNNYEKAMALSMGPCNLCDTCTVEKGKPCIYPEKKRPSVEGLGIDMISTVKKFKKNLAPELKGRAFPSFGLILLE